jgi:eukaryotic-like serine/threonine-protein kinase
LVAVGGNVGASRLWVRPLDSISAQPLPGSEDAISPFWSPDSRSLGFFASRKLKRIDLGGGQPRALADVVSLSSQGAWSADGTILFNPTLTAGPLLRIPAAGGQAVAATRLGKGEVVHFLPRFLPGGRQFLFASFGSALTLWLGSLGDPGADHGAGQATATDSRRITADTPGAESPGEYLAPGWLVRVRGNALVAQRFDAARGQLSGDTITLAQAAGIDPYTLGGSFSVSASSLSPGDATIAWRSGAHRRQLMWFNRSGQNMGAFGAADESHPQYPEISPDGRRAAVTRGLVLSRNIWMQDCRRDAPLAWTRWKPYGTNRSPRRAKRIPPRPSSLRE